MEKGSPKRTRKTQLHTWADGCGLRAGRAGLLLGPRSRALLHGLRPQRAPLLGVAFAACMHVVCCAYVGHLLRTSICASGMRDCLSTCLVCCFTRARDPHVQVGSLARVKVRTCPECHMRDTCCQPFSSMPIGLS